MLDNLLRRHQRTSIYGHRAMKQRFLVNYDYGMGGVWAFLFAESEEQIRRRFPELTVVHDPPDWLDERERKVLEDNLTVDIDDESAPILRELLNARR